MTPSPSPTTPPNNGGGGNNGGGNNGGGNNGGGNNGGGSTGGSSSSGGSVILNTCNLITSYMKRGLNNPPVEVVKLQVFLRDFEHMNLKVTGIFDLETEAAVNAFQKKYESTVLAPWGDFTPSGFVYITTTKNINRLACGKPLILNRAEISIIESYKSRYLASLRKNSLAVVPKDEIATVQNDNIASSTVIGGNNNALPSNTAAVGNTTLWSRMKGFVKWLFRR